MKDYGKNAGDFSWKPLLFSECAGLADLINALPQMKDDELPPHLHPRLVLINLERIPGIGETIQKFRNYISSPASRGYVRYILHSLGRIN
jgi:hypothetical protein